MFGDDSTESSDSGLGDILCQKAVVGKRLAFVASGFDGRWVVCNCQATLVGLVRSPLGNSGPTQQNSASG